jgi:hypothetical protein
MASPSLIHVLYQAVCSLSFAMAWYGPGGHPWYIEFLTVFILAAVATGASTIYRIWTDHDTFFLQPLNIAALSLVLRTFFLRMPPSPRNTCFLLFIAIGAIIHVGYNDMFFQLLEKPVVYAALTLII